MTTEYKKKFLIDVFYLLVIVAIIYFGFKFLSLYLLPFVIGIGISFFVQRPVKFISKKLKLSKRFVTVFFVLLSYALLITAISLIIFITYKWLSGLAALLPEYIPVISKAFSTVSDSLAKTLNTLPNEITDFLTSFPEKIISSLTGWITSMLSSATKIAATKVPAFLVTTIVTIVASCYIAKDYHSIIIFAGKHIPYKIWDIIIEIKDLFTKSIFKFLKGYLLLMIITFVELTVGLWLIGEKNCILLAGIIAVVDILPVLGTGTILIPWALITLALNDVWKAVFLLLIYIVITVIRNFIEPKIIGEQVGLHPILALISIFVGYKLIGFTGIFLFPLTLICISDLIKKDKIKLFNNLLNKKTNS